MNDGAAAVESTMITYISTPRTTPTTTSFIAAGKRRNATCRKVNKTKTKKYYYNSSWFVGWLVGREEERVELIPSL